MATDSGKQVPELAQQFRRLPPHNGQRVGDGQIQMKLGNRERHNKFSMVPRALDRIGIAGKHSPDVFCNVGVVNGTHTTLRRGRWGRACRAKCYTSAWEEN